MADAFEKQITEAVKTRLQSLTFAVQGSDRGPAPTAIYIAHDRDKDGGYDLPSLLITPGRDFDIDPMEGPNCKDDYTYPVLVQVLRRRSTDYEGDLATVPKWLEQIYRAFHQQKLIGVTEVYIGLARRVSRHNLKDWVLNTNFDGGVLLLFKTRLSRGITT